jgi:uncharacterized protein (DUF2141 family)
MKSPGMKNFTVLLLALAIVAVASPPALADGCQLLIKASGFESDKGQVLFVVVDSPEAYDDLGANDSAANSIARSLVKIVSGKAQGCFVLPVGWYAVSVVHDENNNSVLDANFLGIPKEPYGFSNNPRGLGKPSFEAVKFRLDASPKTIEVTVE